MQAIRHSGRTGLAGCVSAIMCAGMLTVLPQALADPNGNDESQAGNSYIIEPPSEQWCHKQEDNSPDLQHIMVSKLGESAPQPGVRCHVQSVHTDAISTYITAGEHPQLVLKSKADAVYTTQDGRTAENGVRYDSENLAFIVPDEAKHESTGLPEAYNFLAKATNNGSFWYIPQTQLPNIIWAGMSTEALQGNPHVPSDATVNIALKDFKGPGQLYMWLDELTGIRPAFGSPSTGFPTTHQLNIPQHEHMNWAFTAPGRYVFTLTATTTIDGKLASATQQYVFYVGSTLPKQATVLLEGKASRTEDEVKADVTVTSPAFTEMQGWIEWTNSRTGAIIGHSKVVNNASSFTWNSPANELKADQKESVIAHFIPQFREDSLEYSTTIPVDLAQDHEPDASGDAGTGGQESGNDNSGGTQDDQHSPVNPGTAPGTQPGDENPAQPGGQPHDNPQPHPQPTPTPVPPVRPVPPVHHPAPAPVACTSKNFVLLDHGHMDLASFSSTAHAHQLALQEDVTGSHIRRSLSTVMIVVGEQARRGGSYILPQTQAPHLPWLGWNNQHLSKHVPVTWHIDRVQGPGFVRIWTDGVLGSAGQTILDSRSKTTYVIPPNTHAHANWEFSRDGYYAITMTTSSSLGSSTATVYFTIGGNLDPRAMQLNCAVANNARGQVINARVVESASHDHHHGSGDNTTYEDRSSTTDANMQDAMKNENSDSNELTDDDKSSADKSQKERGKQSSRAAYNQKGFYGLFNRHPLMVSALLILVGALAALSLAAVFMWVLSAKKKAQ